MPWSNQPAIAPLEIITSGAPNTGLFVYSGTPKSGNPPVFSVVAPSVTSDPFGNAVEPVMSAGNPAGAQITVDAAGNLIAYSPAHNKIILIHPDLSAFLIYSAAGSGAGNLIASIAEAAGTDNFGNAFQAGFTTYNPVFAAFANLFSALLTLGDSAFSANGSVAAFTQGSSAGPNLTLTAPEQTGSSAAGILTIFSGNTAGTQGPRIVPSGPMVAAQPGTTATPETWHTITLDAGWSTAAGHAAPSYQLLADGNVQLTGFASHAAFTVSTALNSGTPLPAAYRPVTSKYLRAGDSNRAGLSLGTNGVITAFPVSGGSTQLELDSIYPLNL